MIHRPCIYLLLAVLLAFAAGCDPSSIDSSPSMAVASDVEPDSTKVFKSRSGAEASTTQQWSAAVDGDKPKMNFATGDGNFVSKGKAQPQGVKLPEGMSFSSKTPNSDDGKIMADLDKDVPQLSEADQLRYNDVAIKLVTAINAEDRETYRALFTDECWAESISWWREMFAVQTSINGRIARAYAPQKGFLKFSGMAFRGDSGARDATIVIHFEEPSGGALTITLDEDGLISKTNTYIKSELAFMDPGDDKIIYELDE